MERLDVSGAFAVACAPGPSGPPAPPAPPLRHDVAGTALALAFADDGQTRWRRYRSRRSPSLPSSAPPAQLSGTGDEAHWTTTATYAQQTLDAAAQGTGEHQLSKAERFADPRTLGGTGGSCRGGCGGTATRSCGATTHKRTRLATTCRTMSAQLRAGRCHGKRRQTTAQPCAQRLQATGLSEF